MIKDEPAFPVPEDSISIATKQGMTLRDYFVAKAMQSLYPNNYHILDLAEKAYEMADVMLKQRKRGTKI